MNKSRVIIRSVADRPVDEVISEILSFCGAQESIRPDSKVIIKPNLCTERFDMIPTANTSHSVLDAVVKHVRDITPHVTIGESDGARYTVEQAYENNGIYGYDKP